MSFKGLVNGKLTSLHWKKYRFEYLYHFKTKSLMDYAYIYLKFIKKKMIQHTEYSRFSNTLVKHNLWCCNVVTENFDFCRKEYNEFFKL